MPGATKETAINQNILTANNLEKANMIGQGGVFASIFTFFSRHEWHLFFEMSVWHYILLPVAVLTDWIKLGLAIRKLWIAENRNLDKCFVHV